MHNYQAKYGATFHFNSDFSGEIEIKSHGKSLKLAAADLLEFVAYRYVLPRRVERLEEADAAELLCGKLTEL